MHVVKEAKSANAAASTRGAAIKAGDFFMRSSCASASGAGASALGAPVLAKLDDAGAGFAIELADGGRGPVSYTHLTLPAKA